jgi:hypothetical protein
LDEEHAKELESNILALVLVGDHDRTRQQAAPHAHQQERSMSFHQVWLSQKRSERNRRKERADIHPFVWCAWKYKRRQISKSAQHRARTEFKGKG